MAKGGDVGRHQQPGECFLFISVSQRPPQVLQVCLGTALERAIDPAQLLPLYRAQLCPHPHTLRRTIREQATLKVTV